MRQLLDAVGKMNLPSRSRSRVAEDEGRFTYGQRTIEYYAACARAWQEARQNHLEEARQSRREAERLGVLLRADTESMDTAISPSRKCPGRSLAPNAVKQLDKVLGTADTK